MLDNTIQPEFATGSPKFADKRAVAAMVGCCVRSVDNLMVRGCPYLKLGRRKIRFDLDEVRNWLKREYGTSRIGKEVAK